MQNNDKNNNDSNSNLTHRPSSEAETSRSDGEVLCSDLLGSVSSSLSFEERMAWREMITEVHYSK